MIRQINIFKNFVLVVVAVSASCIFCGCAADGQPHTRIGSYATATLGTNFLDENDLGKHSYAGSRAEKDGIVYTCRGGHIDIAHVRIAADYVDYTYQKTKRTLMRTNSDFSFKLNTDRSIFYVEFEYPDNWKSISREDKEKIADEMAFELSQYFTFTMVTWHEVLTWFGYKSLGVFPEFPSAFSWEDSYSNIIGVRVGAEAVADKQHDFDEAVTIAIKKELDILAPRSRKVARDAAEKMKGKWWEGTPFVVFVEMKERNMDIGLIDGYVTPILVPGICRGQTPLSYPVPTVKTLAKYGFTMKLEIEPREFEKEKIFRIIHPQGDGKHINPSTDLPIIMDHIQRQATQFGYETMPPKQPSYEASAH